jgi:DNA repair exonuclease SbcCD ATPase subunit/DNA repair exonuclease SbcCD nuclease subunit
MIHNIIHISDIHIREGDSKKSRYDEYITVFNNLCDSISQQPSIINKSAVIVITGDIFHNKNKIGPSGIKIAIYLLKKLAVLANVIVIRGNHDYRQDHPAEPDMISALTSYDIPNVTYLDTTGIYKFNNISFGLTAIQETLLYGSTSGISIELPEFPIPADDSNYKVALFHGTINGCTLQNGLSSTRNGYPIDWFKGYDAILLGDIHLQQIRRATIIDNQLCNLPHTSICQTYSYDGQIPWGYSGSLLQQDFGETIKGHGYVLWNLQDKIINVYHIKNKYGMIKVHYNGIIEELMVEHKQFIKPITKVVHIDKILSYKWFPDILQVRVYGQDISQDILNNISTKIISFGKQIQSITKKDVILNDNKESEEINTTDSTKDIQNINTIDSLISFIQDKVTSQSIILQSDKWKEWLLQPESIKFSSQYIPENISSKLIKRIETIDKDILDFTNEFEKIQTIQSITGSLSLNKLEWNWVLNYKNNNVLDFDNNHKKINSLNAKNAQGKTNCFEIICIALFGEGFQSRHNTKYSSTIICNKKPDGVMASTQIKFTLNGVIYIIERTMRNNTVKRAIKFEDVTLYKLNTITNTKEIIHQKDNAVSAWVETNIGYVSTYLMSTMLTQNADNDFFSLDNAKQKELLDNVLSLTHINSLKKLLKDSSVYYKNGIELLESYVDGVKSNTKIVDQKYINELESCKLELNNILSIAKSLFTKWHTVSQYELSKYSDSKILESILANIQTKIDSLPDMSINEIKNMLNETNNSIKYNTNELSKLHNFSDLLADDDIDLSELNAKDTKDIISQTLTYLQQHPFFKDKKYSLYEQISDINSKINDEFENEYENSYLIQLVHEYHHWNKLQSEKFGDSAKYVLDESEISKLQTNINSLIQEITDYPDMILDMTKRYDKLRKQFKLINKEKDLCMDKKPNKPSKDDKWLHTVEENILKYGTLADYEYTKECIMNSIQHIPIVCNKIVGCVQKIREYEQYISDCVNYPFNPECNACKLQPWRTKYDSYVEELPNLKIQLSKLKMELDELKCDDINIQLNYNNYGVYLDSLKNESKNITKQINDILTYNTEKQLISNWNTWLNMYNEIRSKCEKLDTEINDIESQKKKMELNFEKKRSEKRELQTRLETIQTKKNEYEQYVSEKADRDSEYNDVTNMLQYNWYLNLHIYRTHIDWYITLISEQNDDLLIRKKEYEKNIEIANERIKLLKEFVELDKIYKAYPYWLQWKEIDNKEKTISSRIKELEIIVKGYTNGTDDTGIIECVKLIEILKNDYQDILYISEAFEGYREWLYTNCIGPIIQKRVNEILEMMCEDRPLYLECEWLDVIDTLSWFIRDSGSKVIIQKASGFQRFIVGIAMRVAINQIGLSKMRFNELFIDEGFTSCDIDNLEKVPEFLRGLLRYYGSIYLATHLEDLKCCADNHIYIKRDDNGLSQIQYGDTEMIKEVEDNMKNKRRGRPPKNSVHVTKV